VPFGQEAVRRHRTPRIAVPETFETPAGERLSTQEAFGRLLSDVARRHPDLADRIVTTSPDVTISTNLGGWVNRRGVFSLGERRDVFRESAISSAQSWALSPQGQHIELGIAENNLFTLLAALGLSGPLFGARLLPIGTVYDPFIARGLDALNYACYQDARFILVATPSGITLAPEGGAHQSVYTPLIGMGQPGLAAYEPAYSDELAEILRWSLEHLQAEDGGSVYLRLSTRPLEQPGRHLTHEMKAQVVAGGYWLTPPGAGAEMALVGCGAVLPEVLAAHRAIVDEMPGTGILVVTSPARLHRDWIAALKQPPAAASHVEALLDALPSSAGLVTVHDAHPAALSWLGSVRRHRIVSLGLDRFGQSGDIPDLYRTYGIDESAILDAVARLLVSGRE
jgi:pyruvate dehydrogenase E1 component